MKKLKHLSFFILLVIFTTLAIGCVSTPDSLSRGITAFSNGDYDKAIADFTEAILIRPNYAIAYHNRGLAYYTKGDYELAIADYETALRLDPNYGGARIGLERSRQQLAQLGSDGEPVLTQTQNSDQPVLAQSPSGGQIAPVQSSATYFTGNGGRGIRLGILMPHRQGLTTDQEYLSAMVQGVLVSDFSKYSAISVLDRVSLDRVITETLDLTYEDDLDIVSLGHVAQVGHMLTGSIIRTLTGFSLQLNVTDTTPQANTVASYSGIATTAELDDHSAIHQASLELLSQMNVALTARARNELNRPSAQETISAQAALARGINAWQQGTEVAALSYFLQAAALDPSLAEAETRLNNLTAYISSGIMGADVRSDIQWRTQWVSRLRETEMFLTQYRRENPAFYLVYSSEQGEVNYARETITLSVELRGLPEPMWFETINQLNRTIRNGLLATGRAETWQINWPAQSITMPSPFFVDSATYAVVVEIFNASGNSIARQNVNLSCGGWFIPQRGDQRGVIAPYLRSGVKVDFPGIDVHTMDNLSIRITSVNNMTAERATSQLGLRVLARDDYDNIPSIAENGLRTENLRNFDIRFSQNTNLIRGYQGGTFVAIPYGVTWIDRDSALRNRGLSGVTIPSSVTYISDEAFRENVMTSVSIPDSVTSIGNYAFVNNRLTSVFIGNSVTSIGNSAFRINRLTSVSIPDSVVSIGEYAFYENADLRSVTIGANVSLIGGIYGSSFSQGFFSSYNNNNSRAGTYTYSGNNWNYSPRR